MKITTHLISGAGNTFHVIWNSAIADVLTQKQITEIICQKNQADGCIFLNLKNGHYGWDFYNKDGSIAEMCGNATRCVGFYVKNILNSPGNKFQLQTAAGLIQINILENNLFQIQMTPIQQLVSATHFFCDTGVPHIVIPINDFENFRNYFSLCQELRSHSDFGPRGTNVTLVSAAANQSDLLKAVSYERGVEDFTAACGTGAAAAAFYNFKKTGCTHSTIEMPGGILEFNLENLSQPVMTGPAILLGEYTYDIKT